MSLKTQVISGAKWNTIAVVVNTAVQMLRIVILSRVLDVSDFGILAIAMAVVSFTEIFADLGFTVPIIHKQNITNEQYSSVFWVNVIMSIAIMGILILASPIISRIYEEPSLTSIICALSSTVVINAFGKIFHTIKTKELEFKFISIVSIVSAVIGFATMVALALLDFGVWSLVLGTIIQTATRQVVYFISGLKSSRIKFHLNLRDITDFLRIGGYQVGAVIMDFWSNKIDVFILGKFIGMEYLGIYNLAKELIIRIYALFVSLSRSIATATFAKMQNDMKQLVESFIKFSKLYAYVIVPCFCMLFIFTSDISSVMYGDKAALLYEPLKILSIYGIFLGLTAPTTSLMLSLGRSDFSLKWTIINTIINTICICIAGNIGFKVILYSQVALSIILYFLNWKLMVNRLINISLWQYMRPHLSAIIIAIPLVIIFCILTGIIDNSVMWSIILAAAFIGIFGIISMFTNKISPKELTKLIFR